MLTGWDDFDSPHLVSCTCAASSHPLVSVAVPISSATDGTHQQLLMAMATIIKRRVDATHMGLAGSSALPGASLTCRKPTQLELLGQVCES